jgi:hypothetical protein
MSGVFQNIDPHSLSARRVCTPRLWTHSLGEKRVGPGGSIFWKTPDTALYSTYVSTLRKDRRLKEGRFKIFQMPLLVIVDFFSHPVDRFFNFQPSAQPESIVPILIYGQRSGPGETINNVKLDAEMYKRSCESGFQSYSNCRKVKFCCCKIILAN